MSVKRYLACCIIASLIFIAGVLVGRHISSPEVVVVTIDVDALATLIEKFNVPADEIRKDMAVMKEWNENALTEEPKEEDKK